MAINIDWTSFFFGAIAAFLLVNIIMFIGAYVRRNKAREKMKEFDARIDAVKQDLVVKQKQLEDHIEQMKGKEK
ncbi:MAG: hypothetical protein ABIJ26_01730 [Candidatus Margulisiibacteriota bacterium]